MATNGIISIIKNDQVQIKCVAGCNGMEAEKTAKALSELQNPTIDEVYKVCLDNHFGCKDCTVVQSETEHRCHPDYQEEELDPLYKEKFNDPHFNPRWSYGTAAYKVVINLDKDFISIIE